MRKSFVAVVAVVAMLFGVGACSPDADTDADVNVSEPTGLPACVNEDGSTADGYQEYCYWDGGENGTGERYVLADGERVLTLGGVDSTEQEPEQEAEQEADADPAPDYEAMADAVIRGEYGDGEARRVALGDDYDMVQSIVDGRMASVITEPDVTVASQPATVPEPVASEPGATPETDYEAWKDSVRYLPACDYIDGDDHPVVAPCYYFADEDNNMAYGRSFVSDADANQLAAWRYTDGEWWRRW